MPRTKTREKAAGPKQNYHYYASTAYNWAVGATRNEAIAAVLKQARTYAGKKASESIYVWSVRVNLPQDAYYTIEFYRPVGVPISESMDGDHVLVGDRAFLSVDDAIISRSCQPKCASTPPKIK